MSKYRELRKDYNSLIEITKAQTMELADYEKKYGKLSPVVRVCDVEIRLTDGTTVVYKAVRYFHDNGSDDISFMLDDGCYMTVVRSSISFILTRSYEIEDR